MKLLLYLNLDSYEYLQIRKHNQLWKILLFVVKYISYLNKPQTQSDWCYLLCVTQYSYRP